MKEWIRGVLGDATLFTERGVSFLAALKSGVVLCELVNRLQPGTIARIVRSKFEYQQIDNIVCFRWACEKLGLQETLIFSTSDLFEGRNGGRVLDTLLALARFAVANGLTAVQLREPAEADSLYMQTLTESAFVCPTDAETAQTPCEPAQRPLLDWANGHLRRAAAATRCCAAASARAASVRARSAARRLCTRCTGSAHCRNCRSTALSRHDAHGR